MQVAKDYPGEQPKHLKLGNSTRTSNTRKRAAMNRTSWNQSQPPRGPERGGISTEIPLVVSPAPSRADALSFTIASVTFGGVLAFVQHSPGVLTCPVTVGTCRCNYGEKLACKPQNRPVG